MPNRGFKVIGSHTPLGFIWYKDIVIQDSFALHDVVYLNGAAMLATDDHTYRYGIRLVDVTTQFMAGDPAIDETQQALLSATR